MKIFLRYIYCMLNQRKILKCKRCGYIWTSARKPQACANPKCRSLAWAKPKTIAKAATALALLFMVGTARAQTTQVYPNLAGNGYIIHSPGQTTAQQLTPNLQGGWTLTNPGQMPTQINPNLSGDGWSVQQPYIAPLPDSEDSDDDGSADSGD